MKRFIYIFLTIFVGFATFVACDKKEDDKTPDTNAAQKECENKNHQDSTYTWVDNKCVATFTGTPIIQKDTTLLWNIPNSNGAIESGNIGFPTRFQLDSVQKLPGVGNIVLKLYTADQRGPSQANISRLVDSLTVWVQDGLVTIYKNDKLLMSAAPKEELVNKGMNIGLLIEQWSDITKSGGNGSKAAREPNSKFSTKNEY